MKHDKDLVNELKKVVDMLANDEILDKRYKNHSLNDEYKKCYKT
ncbi:type II toxin-antitoxin system YafQ family toxin [Campylobacter sputorum]|nr:MULTISPECIES: type II toxin-antitoxin system YafQ family toxin [Campylobacter]